MKFDLAKAVVVSERGSQSSGADDADAMRGVETEYLRDVIAQVVDVVADAAHAKLTEVPKIFPDLSGIEVELVGQRLRRNGLYPEAVREAHSGNAGKHSSGWLLVLIFFRTSLAGASIALGMVGICHTRPIVFAKPRRK